MRHAPSLLFVLALAGSCSSTSSQVDRMYRGLHEDVRDRGADPRAARELAERNANRAAKIRRIAEAGELEGGPDHLKAAVILVETDDMENLELSLVLALKAVEFGEPLGRRVAAEAIDKQLVKTQQQQKYGTQYEWVPVLSAWRLYPLDPETTDAEREGMGVPRLSELLEGEARLNERFRPKSR